MRFTDWVEDIYGYHKKYITEHTQYQLFGFAITVSTTQKAKLIKNSPCKVKFYGELLHHDVFKIDNKIFPSFDDAKLTVDSFLQKLSKLEAFL